MFSTAVYYGDDSDDDVITSAYFNDVITLAYFPLKSCFVVTYIYMIRGLAPLCP